MCSASVTDATLDAYLTYTVDTGVKPVTGTTNPDGGLRHRSDEFQDHLMTIRDARPYRDSLSLDREGFVRVRRSDDTDRRPRGREHRGAHARVLVNPLSPIALPPRGAR